MGDSTFPRFIYSQLPTDADTTFHSLLRDRAETEGGTVLALADSAAVECLETGTPNAACALIQFDEHDALQRTWAAVESNRSVETLRSHPAARVLSIAGLPYIGMPEAPDIPTTASVEPPSTGQPRAYMVIQGNVYDQARIDGYRDIILPMIKDLGAYYTIFDLGGDVVPLLGSWDYQIFAVSRWPEHKAGHDFWDSERYQSIAIPQRTGAGEFTVHFFVGTAG